MACSTRCDVSAEMDRFPLRTYDTVLRDTPACRATSAMVTAIPAPYDAGPSPEPRRTDSMPGTVAPPAPPLKGPRTTCPALSGAPRPQPSPSSPRTVSVSPAAARRSTAAAVGESAAKSVRETTPAVDASAHAHTGR